MDTTTPTRTLAAEAVERILGWRPEAVQRFATGSGHFVFEAVRSDGHAVVVRMGMPDRRGAMTEGTRLLRQLAARGVPLPELLAEETIGGFPFVLMQRLAGTDLGHVIRDLSDGQLKAIAASVAAAQQATSGLATAVRYGYAPTNGQAPFLLWSEVLAAHLERSRQRLLSAALFDPAVLEPTAAWLAASRDALDRQPAIPFLHDTTTKNVIIDESGRFSGIVDVDDLCFGDPRYAPALTLAVLKGYGGPQSYVAHWMAAADHATDEVFRLYVAIFLLDLMAEHGQVFNGNEMPSTPEARAGLQRALDEVMD